MKKRKRSRFNWSGIAFILLMCSMVCAAFILFYTIYPDCLPSDNNYRPDFPIPTQAQLLTERDVSRYRSAAYMISNVSQDELIEYFETELDVNCNISIGVTHATCGGRLTRLANFHINIHATNTETQSTEFNVYVFERICESW